MNTMRANWHTLTIGGLVVFVMWIFYKLATYGPNSKHAVDQHHGHKHGVHEGTFHTQIIDLGLATASSELKESREKDLTLKLIKAERKIIELKMLLSKERKKAAKRQVTRSQIKKFKGHRLVHLDLKGAPPKMPYLIQLLSDFKEWGATGLLVEYEDMFPYSGDLEVLKAKHAYSQDDITHFLEECENQNLIVVPLIQTFGHMEFVLKHKVFAHLRETKLATNSICPIKNGSVPLIKMIIDQVLQLHPKIRYFHVGGDEVFNLKTCNMCMADRRSKIRLFIDHMTPILKHIKQKNLIPLMWDDMMRKAEIKDMKELGTLMEPMVWGYGTILQGHFPPGMWERFSAVFPKMWVASGFKGATKPDSIYVPIKFHLQNNLDWLDAIQSLPKTTTIEGIALTGWSRYDHYAALCELLPAGLPSLAFCLKALTHGEMNDRLEKEVVKSLGLPQNFSLEITPYKREYEDVPATFPGHEIYTLVGNLTKALYSLNGVRHLKSGWMLPRHIANKFLSYQHVHNALNYSQYAFDHLMSLHEEFLEPLNEIFDEDTVKEWIRDKITDNMRYAKRKVKELSDLEKRLE